MPAETPETGRAPSLGAGSSLLWGGLVGGLIGALLVGLVMKLGSSLPASQLAELPLFLQLAKARRLLTGWDLLVLPGLMLIVLGTHEVGHLLGGLSQGMRFLMLIVGPFGWHASAAGPRFQWNTNLALMGGLAATLPTQVGALRRRQLLFSIAGGPLASLWLSLLALALAAVFPARWAAYGTFVGVVSFGIFLVTLIPVRSGGFMSDGLQLLDVLRGGRDSIQQNAVMQIFAQSLDGVRPRDWDPSAIDELARADCKDPLSRTGSCLFLLARAMDEQQAADIARYQTLLQEGVDLYPSGFRQSIHVELAICAWLTGDAESVRRHLRASRGGIVEKSRRLLAEGALAQLEGRAVDCERNRLLAIQALAKASDAGLSRLTADQLALLQSKS